MVTTVHCAFNEVVPIAELKEHPKNPNRHSAKQIALLAKIIAHQGWRAPIVVSKRSGFIVAGHGRLMAARLLGIEAVPVNFQEFASGEDELAHLVADNRIAELAEMDDGTLNEILAGLTDSLDDVEITGFSRMELDHLFEQANENNAEQRVIFPTQDVIETAFQFFRKNGFPYPHLERFEMMQSLNRLANTATATLPTTREGYQIADTYNKHRFQRAALGMKTPLESFAVDKALRKAIAMEIASGGMIGTGPFGAINLINGTQACSNFRPGMARYIYERFGPKEGGGRVFDSSTGYGGRLVGFLASRMKEYYGTDPNLETFLANKRMIEELNVPGKTVVLFNLPAEDLDISSFSGSCDVAFTSPPYFSKEIYSEEETQSYKRYPEYEQWLEGFLRPMIRKNFEALKPGAAFVLNIEDVNIKTKRYELVNPSIAMAKEIGFAEEDQLQFQLPVRTYLDNGVKTERNAIERVLVFRKPSVPA